MFRNFFHGPGFNYSNFEIYKNLPVGGPTAGDIFNDSAKAMVGFARRFRPTYAEANVGHPSGSYWVLLGDVLTQRL